ncbi:MAG: mechanosensitive ion channel family protein [Ignavibacteriales bacterium]|nr:mechanosensitive ion channel family protein [Ignavibacteriales bacterium]MCF8306213.1 mechanosensitive ion channel family protein [Ignavibacteriales bacterium]MCF8315934.1 mechanosensitive ion channel family protein [Ignavibacteriales bacterium]MCF8437528.1 mechanosensitive ion channel family protein [Ignavibacteriales bacterium]
MLFINLRLVFLILLFAFGISAQNSNTPGSADTLKISETVKDSSENAINKKNLTSPPIENVKEIVSFNKILWSLIFLVISYYVIKFITNLLNRFSEKSASYRITLKGFIPIFRISSWTIAIYIIIAGIIAPPVETVLLMTGSLGIAVGFAAQDLLKNIFGGMLVILDRPFQVGDKIEIGNYYGEVLSIGLRSVRIVTPDDSVVSIPNGEIMNQSVSNANTGAADCQVVAEMYLPAHVDTAEVRSIAIRAAQVSKYVYLNKPVVVIIKSHALQNRAVLKVRLKAYVLDIRYEFPFMSEMTEKTLKSLIDHNIVTIEELDQLNEFNKA